MLASASLCRLRISPGQKASGETVTCHHGCFLKVADSHTLALGRGLSCCPGGAGHSIGNARRGSEKKTNFFCRRKTELLGTRVTRAARGRSLRSGRGESCNRERLRIPRVFQDCSATPPSITDAVLSKNCFLNIGFHNHFKSWGLVEKSRNLS